MEYSDKNEHLNDDPLEITNEKNEAQAGETADGKVKVNASDPLPEGKNGHPDEPLTSETSKDSIQPPEESELISETVDPALIRGENIVSSENDGLSESGDEKPTGSAILPAKHGEGEEDLESAELKEDDNPGEYKKKKSEKKTFEKVEEKVEEKINYDLLSKSDLVKVFDDILSNKPFDQIRSEVDQIHDSYQKKFDEEFALKRENFIADGGLEQDFKPAEDPVDKKMTELSEKYKTLRADYSKQLEEVKEENLRKKQEILEELRLLMEGQEGFENTFRKFRQLQNKWFEAGIVPKQNVKDLWNSYNYFVDKFNDYVNINRELRAMDFKKNLDLKIKLCEKAEELASETNVTIAFKTLQKYHTQWREIGPVPREEKDKVWERFKAATSVINKAHQNFQSQLKDSLVDNLEHKNSLCLKAEEFAKLELHNHGDWVEKTNELLAIQKEWKSVGYAPKKDNNIIYARFRRACDRFFEKKATFYSETFEHQKENVEKKRELIEEAKGLVSSTDWKKTSEILMDLQKRWKEVGPVPRKESDKLWRQFRSACDQFFSSKSEFFSGKNDSYEDNLKAKQDLILEMTQFKPASDKKAILHAMEDFQNRYNEIGFVPVEFKDKIRDEFQAALNAIIERVSGTENQKSLIRFRIRIASILSVPKGENKLRFERDKLMNKLQQLKNDIGVWENNIGFFKQTQSSEGTISEFHEKIEDARSRIELLEQKIRIIDELDDDN